MQGHKKHRQIAIFQEAILSLLGYYWHIHYFHSLFYISFTFLSHFSLSIFHSKKARYFGTFPALCSRIHEKIVLQVCISLVYFNQEKRKEKRRTQDKKKNERQQKGQASSDNKHIENIIQAGSPHVLTK